MKQLHPLVNYITSFFNGYLSIQRGLSANTILSYRDSLKLFFSYVADKLTISAERLNLENLDEANVLEFLLHLENVHHVSVATRNNRLAAIRSFFKFVGREEPALLEQVYQLRSIPLKKQQCALVTYLEEDELRAMLKAINTQTISGLRDKSLLLLLYNTGARVQEVVDLNLNDLRLDAMGQVKLLGKGHKQRACPLWRESVAAIKDYIKHREESEKESEALFLNNRGQRLTRFGIRYIIKKYVEIAAEHCPSLNNKKVGPHTIRHSTAMHLLRSGNDINMVKLWLGHSDLNTTHQYIELDIKMKRAILLKTTCPKGKIDKEPSLWRQDKVLKWLKELTYPEKLCEVES